MTEENSEYEAWQTGLDEYSTSLKPKEIEAAKRTFIKYHGSLDDCACVDCPLQKENRCVFQFDVYNTKDDWCLMEK